MISCTEFIYTYNELFKYILERHGRSALENLWKEISDKFLSELDRKVREKGLKGMHEYWSRTLTEEDAVFELELTPDRFEIRMKKCPSVYRAIRSPGGYCREYCEHCPALYCPLIEKYGFDTDCQILDREKGICRLTVAKKVR